MSRRQGSRGRSSCSSATAGVVLRPPLFGVALDLRRSALAAPPSSPCDGPGGTMPLPIIASSCTSVSSALFVAIVVAIDSWRSRTGPLERDPHTAPRRGEQCKARVTAKPACPRRTSGLKGRRIAARGRAKRRLAAGRRRQRRGRRGTVASARWPHLHVLHGDRDRMHPPHGLVHPPPRAYCRAQRPGSGRAKPHSRANGSVHNDSDFELMAEHIGLDLI